MHQYQTDDNAKTNFLIFAVLLAVGLAYLFGKAISALQIQIPWYVESPSILGFFGAIYWLYDKYLWKTKWVQMIDWIKTPNISGKWDVEIRTSHDSFTEKTSGKAIIRQSAFRISIALETKSSISSSIHAALMRTEKVSEYELTYNYINHPKADSIETMSIHMGTTRVSLSDDGKQMDGEYYTGRDRQNFGRITLLRT
ncbi:MAG TPA: hypothetical protein PKI33_10445 [Anaerolineales bacterium]|nr:hypothetical protein [Anaerolineales bacterium]HNM37477.1 hypothetical protein [Anaerolineales bacterium]